MDNLIRRAHMFLILLTIIGASYCIAIMAVDQGRDHETANVNSIIQLLRYSVYALVIIYRITIVVAFSCQYAALLR